jgi:hypothetical protein
MDTLMLSDLMHHQMPGPNSKIVPHNRQRNQVNVKETADIPLASTVK